jgi:hypothetical protein
MAAPKKEEITFIGGNKGKKGKKPKAQTKDASESFKIDLEVIKKFGIVNVSPPVAPEDLEPKIVELKTRLVKLNSEGEKELENIKTELAKNIDLAVNEDIEREQKAMEDQYGEEEDRPYRGGRGGRGGRGRGGRGGERRYGDYSPDREEKKTDGGYFGQKFGVKPQRGEFEGSDDDNQDDYTSSAYSKPTRGGVQGKGAPRGGKKNLALDEENFPTL